MVKILFRILVVTLLAVYPVCVFFGLQYFQVKTIGLILLTVLVIRMALDGGGVKSKQLLASSVLGILLAVVIFFSNDELYLRLYPVLINVLFFGVFALSIVNPPSMIERFARMQESDLSDEAIVYTRNVTLVWCLFFVANGSIALWTALYSDLEIWTLYNGLLSYLIMGAIFAIEFVVRIYKKKSSGM